MIDVLLFLGLLHCTLINGIPDPKCAIGTVDKRITQSNIHSTICVGTYSSTAMVRPSFRWSNTTKTKLMKAYGVTGKSNYELDHIIPLCLGGSPKDIKNLYPQPIKDALIKDETERKLCKLVCEDKMPLNRAQELIINY